MVSPQVGTTTRAASKPLLWGGLLLALVTHCGLAGSYLLATPAFESPDEQDHFLYAQSLLRTGSLPVVRGTAVENGLPAWREQPMGHHPPLYYALLAAVQWVSGNVDLSPTLERRATALSTMAQGLPADESLPKSHPLLWIHGWDEVAPVSLEIRALRLMRGVSVLLGALSVALTFLLGRLAFPERPAIAPLAALLVASWPQWSFAHAALNNDVLANTLAHASLAGLSWALVKKELSPRLAVLLGFLIGAALLTKLSALSLLIVATGAAGVVVVRCAESRRRAGLAIALGGGVLLASCGWFFARNLRLYGELFAMKTHVADYAGTKIPAGRLATYLTERLPQGTLRSLAGSFGWGGIEAPSWMKGLVLFGLALALFGGVASLRRRTERGPRVTVLLLFVAFMTVSVAAYVSYNTRLRQPQARLLFVAAGPAAIFLAAGWVALVDRLLGGVRSRWMARLYLGALVLPLGAALLAGTRLLPSFDFDPNEALPVQASVTANVRSVRPESASTIELLEPADGVDIREPPAFRWRAPKNAPEGARYTVHFLDSDNRVLAATFEWVRMELPCLEFHMPPDFWPTLPSGEWIRWKVRRLPDRSRGESVLETDESRAFAFQRLP